MLVSRSGWLFSLIYLLIDLPLSPPFSPHPFEVNDAVVALRRGGAEIFYELGESKRVTVRVYSGKLLVDLREYYMDKSSGVMKPGKKGLSLSAEQWARLHEQATSICSAAGVALPAPSNGSGGGGSAAAAAAAKATQSSGSGEDTGDGWSE